MLDGPDAKAILREVQNALKAGIAPGFQQAVAANAVALAIREDELGAVLQEAEHVRLAALLGRDGDLAELNGTLANAIRDRAVDVDRDDLTTHLIRTTIAKMEIDQPNYPAFRAWKGDAK